MAFEGKLGELSIDITTNTNKALGELKRFQGKLKDIGSKLSLGITAPLTYFGKQAIQAAADAEEMRNKFATVFGESSKFAKEWADNFASEVGRSSTVLQGFAADTQSLLVSSGLQKQAAADLSTSLTQLALDWASFSNVQDPQAINAFQKALLGENEALKGVGLALSQAEVQAELYRMGVTESWNEVDRATKAQATYNLLVQKTAEAHGDLAKTSGSATNQMKAVGAAFHDIQVIVGQQLLPMFTPLVSALRQALVAFTSLPAPLQQGAVAFAALAAAIGPLMVVVGTISAPVLAAAAAITALVLAWQNWDQIEEIVKNTYEGVKVWIGEKLKAVLESIKKPIEDVKDFFYGMWDAVVGHSYVPDLVDGVAHHFSRLDAEMVDPTKAATEEVKSHFKSMANEAMSSVAEINNATGQIKTDTTAVGTQGQTTDRGFQSGRTIFGSGLNLEGIFSSLISGDIDNIGSQFQSVFSGVIDQLSQQMGGSFGDIFNQLLNSLGGAFGGGGGGGFGGIFGSIFKGIGSIFGGGGGGLFGGFFADGGMPPLGKVSVVGERGPELFVPRTAGTIVPNDEAFGQGGGVTVVNNNNFQGVNSVNKQELARALEVNKRQTINEIQDRSTRGGRFPASVRG